MPTLRVASLPRRIGLLVTTAVVVATVVAGMPPHGSAVSEAARRPAVVDWGLATEGGLRDLTEVAHVERAVGRRATIVASFAGFAYDRFDAASAHRVAATRAVPMITWEPWDYRRGVDQPNFSLERLIRGDHDDYLRQWGRDLAAYGRPVLLRFAHEMNTRAYPWGEQVNGNRPGQFVSAWRHVRATVRAAGGTNATWVWAPNVSYAGTVPFAQLYPGDGHVDWVALDGYNGGTALPWGGWLTFEQIFGPSLRELAALTRRPVMISETASAEMGGSKAEWIAGLFAALPRHPRIRALVWFEYAKETDWRIRSSPRSIEAFRQGLTSPRFRGRPL